MNANRRLEEFILKLSTRHNDRDIFDTINDIKLKHHIYDLRDSDINSDEQHCNKSSDSINNK